MGSGWSRQVEKPDVRYLIERLRSADSWALSHRLETALREGSAVVLEKEDKEALFNLLEAVRMSTETLSQRLTLVCSDLDDDLYAYEADDGFIG